MQYVRSFKVSFIFKILLFMSVGISTGCAPKLIGAFNGTSTATIALGSGETCSLGSSYTTTSITVSPIYPTNGAKWMDYVKNNNGGTTLFDQPDTACAGTETDFRNCIHGAEKLKASVTGFTSCSGLTASDDLGAFDWYCDSSTSPVRFVTKGLKSTKGLKNLIQVGSPFEFIPNKITVMKSGCSTAVAQSSLATWWTNTFATLPDNSGGAMIPLDGVDDDGAGPDQAYASGTILVGSSTFEANGFQLKSSKLAIVMLSGATLKYAGSATFNCDTGTATCVLTNSTAVKFNWIEGNFSAVPTAGTTADYVMWSKLGRFITIKSSTMSGAVDTGLANGNEAGTVRDSIFKQNGAHGIYAYAWGIDGSVYDGIYAIENTGYGLYNLYGSSVIQNSTFAQNTNYGLAVNCGGVTVVNNRAYNNSSSGFLASGGGGANPDMIWVGNLATNNGGAGLSSGSNKITILNTTAAHNSVGATSGSIYITGGTYTQTLVNSLIPNGMLRFATSTTFVASNTAVWGSTIQLNAGVTSGTFRENLLVDSGATCVVGASADPGIVNGTCANAGASSANLITGINLTNSIVGKASSDSTNTHGGSGGTFAYASITDWANFQNIFRTWGVDGLAFADSSNWGRCTSGSCRIWDWNLKSTDTQVRDRAYNGNSAGDTFVVNSTCPAAVDGNVTITDTASTPRTFLIHAVEVMDPVYNPSGNHNGLCESNEVCIYSPNFGAYQGEGDYYSQGSCTFHDGTVSGVTMYAYPTNGI